jgi:hypothetical protein
MRLSVRRHFCSLGKCVAPLALEITMQIDPRACPSAPLRAGALG